MSTEERKPFNFVYQGKRWNPTSKKMFVALAQVLPDGTMGDTMHFEWKQKLDRVVGNIYTGSERAEGSETVYGLSDALFSGNRWPVESDRLKWVARDTDAAVAKKSATLEANTKKSNELERHLLPLRELYQAARRRGDYAECEAIERAVVLALKKPIPTR